MPIDSSIQKTGATGDWCEIEASRLSELQWLVTVRSVLQEHIRPLPKNLHDRMVHGVQFDWQVNEDSFDRLFKEANARHCQLWQAVKVERDAQVN